MLSNIACLVAFALTGEFELLATLAGPASAAVAVIFTVMQFLKRQREQAAEFRETLGTILKAQETRDATFAERMERIAERLDTHFIPPRRAA